MAQSELPFATPADVARLERELQQMREFMREFIGSIDDQVTTKKALEITGIKSRTTLIAERDRPKSLLTYTQHGRAVTYSRAGCVAHKLARQAA